MMQPDLFQQAGLFLYKGIAREGIFCYTVFSKRYECEV